MAVRTFPVLVVVDDTGAVAAGISSSNVSIASVNDKDGAAIPSHGATLHFDGPRVSADYDAGAHGEAWLTLSITKTGITGINAAPSVYLTEDSSIIKSTLVNPVEASIRLGVGVVLGPPAYPAPTATDFYASNLPTDAASGEYNGGVCWFQTGGRRFAHKFIGTHTVSSGGAVHRFQFATGTGFAAAPAPGDTFDIL